ncbi:glycosyltransferase involved in cell wall biosynthesis [Actinoplanes lutulentus]|uniref:Glycosyltransferase involved in cell wall biosynthesis n=1 Tax=Actinoplanes lutulentus TaxID=1287878 RepID=A0A327ZAB5_9ACTN|nr:glycosyltransferase family 4 protein [Actinoplanes lutulentus]MBB2944692.1 glycosyltransferase involved in cell wall biosynthesis [Actinoplanes lutulentus]RAK35513.1 glycosyltransferase involved in cell wall biosynthesis [Actinoplanes lutulentus]
MKVVVAHNRYREAIPSGENVIVDTEIGQLREAGVAVVPFQRSSDSIAEMPAVQKALLPISPIYGASAQEDLKNLLKSEKPDVLHLHNPYPLLSPWVIRTAHAHGVPVVQTVHNYRQVCSSGLYFRDGHNCRDCRGKVLGWPAIKHRCYRGSAAQSAIMATTLAVHRPTWRSVDRYIALTDKIAAHLVDYGVPPEHIVIKPNGLPDPGQPVPLGDGFLYGARLSPEKGLDLLLDAWRRHPDGSLGVLRIAGDGELRPLAEQAAAERGDVVYLGPLDRAGMTAARNASAVVIAAPTWEDVLPTVILEAMSAGRAVLGTAVGGIPYMVGEGAEAAGWLAQPEAGALAAVLPAARAGAAGAAVMARERYLRHFHPDVLTKRLIEIYADMAHAGR